ncbi:MAG: N-acetylglucosamine-6-phosphate deacetylase [Anaerolineae bacterium]|nr:N-acetylglucosamine-6-phosphate deacetylase [Anaerolineae bacterium]
MLTLSQIKLVTPAGEIAPSMALVIGDDGRIVYAGSMAERPTVRGTELDLDGLLVAPGFIDLHTHGGHGVTFGNLDTLAGDLRAYSAWVAANGVTGFLCSVAAPDHATLLATVRAYADLLDASGFPGAEPLGLHLEGPYLNPEQKGAFNPAWLRPPEVDEIDALLDAGRGWIHQMTLAPELPNAAEAAAQLRARGVVAALGHSAADYATAAAALCGEFTHVTHTFNAQRGFHHREPGVIGAVLTSTGVTAELIADGIHAHPGAMALLLRCLGPERIVLISDAMAAAGLGDGEYTLAGNVAIVKDGVAHTPGGAIAGSTTTLDQCVRNVWQLLGIPVADALRMATRNPAKVIGMKSDLGSLEAGKAANLVVLDTALEVQATWVRGKNVYRR